MKLDTEHDNQKWFVLEAYVDGYPQVTKRDAINTASLADGSVSLEERKTRLVAVVEEYLARFRAVEKAAEELK